VVSPSATVRDLGVFIDQDLTIKTHVQQTASRCFATLRQLRNIRRYIRLSSIPLFLHSSLAGWTVATVSWSTCLSLTPSVSSQSKMPQQGLFFTARRYASAVYAMALCLSASVCLCLSLSVTSPCSTKTAKHRITHTTPHDSSGTLVFLLPKISAKFYRGHPLRGRQMQVGWVKIGDFRQIAGYISKTVQDRFLLKSNEKSYALYRMVTLQMTLSDP